MKTQLGHYDIVAELGRGGMGVVYKGYEPALNRYVAIKVLAESLAHDESVKERFLREARSMAALNDPHIIQIYFIGEDAGQTFFVMEFVEGESLGSLLKREGKLAPEQAARVIFQTAQGLATAHDKGVIHRDIKPGNILISPDGECKVSDFGASFHDSYSQETTQLSGVGSPAYMSPEQIRLEPLNLQTDIYSLGVVLYKLLTGRLPYNASNQLSLTYEILNVSPPPPSAFRPELPAILDEICTRAMEKDLGRRYPSWMEFGKDLSRAFGSLRMAGATLSDSEKYSELRAMSFFSDFDDVVLWEALRIGTWHEFQAGAVVIREGELGESIFMLIKGEVAVTLEGRSLARLQPGWCFGEMLYFRETASQRTTTITAITPITVMEIKARVMRLSSDACQVAFQKAFMRVLIDRLTAANRRIAIGEEA